jgi:hypothetical protein
MKKRSAQPLSEQFPDGYLHLMTLGFDSLAKMMTKFSLCADMDRALGTKNAVAKWARGITVPRMKSERAAHAWLLNPMVEFVSAAAGPGPITYVEPKRVAVEVVEERHFLVAVPAAKADKLMKVLSLMGAEAVEL